MTSTTSTTQTGTDRAAEYNKQQAEQAAARRAERAAKAETLLLQRYPSILSITDRGPSGPTRVQIACDDPQTRQGVSICDGTREIAVQDAFQVHRCAACQAYVTRKTRRAKQAERDKAIRAELKALRASK